MSKKNTTAITASEITSGDSIISKSGQVLTVEKVTEVDLMEGSIFVWTEFGPLLLSSDESVIVLSSVH